MKCTAITLFSTFFFIQRGCYLIMETGKFLTTSEVARIARVSSYTVRVWLQEKKLKGTCPVKNWLVNENDLNEFLNKNKESSELGEVQS